MRFPGQIFGADIIARIQTTISEGLETTRSRLSRQICEWLEWRRVNGKPREIDARKALLELERECLIQATALTSHVPGLAVRAISRDQKKGKLQVNYGLLTHN